MKKNVTNLSGNLMKILSLTIMLAFIVPLMTYAQGGKANFAGTWTYNAEKSTPPPAAAGGGQGGGGGRMGGGNFVAKQDANTLTRVTTRTGQDGTTTTRESVYTLDGKENTLATPAGGGGGGGNAAPAKYTATWSADGKSLTIVTTRTFNDTPTKSTEVWTLTAPKTLSIVTTGTGRDGAPTTRTAVYEIK
jgi:hypothetical protein